MLKPGNIKGRAMTSEFRNKHGRLTAYALACGYVEQKTYFNVVTTLCREYGVYLVRAYDCGARKWMFWETFDKLTDARRHYDHSRALIVAMRG